MSARVWRCAVVALLMLRADPVFAQTGESSPRAVETGSFVDEAGTTRKFAPVYYDWFGRPREKYPIRMSVELAAVLGGELGFYWIKAGTNSEDWDFPDLRERMLTLNAVRFDNNLTITNHVMHPIAGAAYYAVPRLNGMGVFASLGFSTLTSATYEWGFEWLEKVSVNDLIFTPAGGWPLGEFFYQFDNYLNSAPKGAPWANQALQKSLGAPKWLHREIDEPPSPVELPADSLGFSSAYYHRFELGYGFAGMDNDLGRSGYAHDILVGGTIYAMPGFLRPGRFATNFDEGNFSEMRVRMSFSGQGWDDVDAWFSDDYAGYFEQDVRPGNGGPSGHAFLVAGNTAGRLVDRWSLDRSDMWAIAHLIGPAARLWLLKDGFVAKFELSVHGDFAGVASLQYYPWTERYGAEGTKTVLQKHGYYFAFGSSAEFRGTLAYGGAELGYHFGAGVYDSIDGLDREQATVTHDTHQRDQIVELGASLGYTPPGTIVHFGITADEALRRSEIPPLMEKRWDRRATAQIGMRF